MRGILSRDVIVDATLAALDEVGTDHLSLRLITTRLGVTPPAIYEYFDGKDDILRAAAERIYDELRDRMQAPQDGSLDSVVHSTRAYVLYAREHPQRYWLMMRFPPPLAEFSNLDVGLSSAAETFEAGMSSVRAALEQGAIGGDEHLASLAIWSFAHGLATLVTIASLDDEDAAAVVDYALGVLRDGLGSGAAHPV